MDVRKDILWRVYLSYIGMLILGISILVKIVFIQRAEGKYWKGMGDSMHLKYMPIYAERGTIYSEDGNILSTSVPVFDVYIDFGAEGLRKSEGLMFKKYSDSLSMALSALFKDKTTDEYRNLLVGAYQEKKPNRHFLLKRKVSYDQFVKMQTFPLIKEGKNNSGFIFDRRDKRINPYAMLAYRTLGVSRINPAKNVGLEQSYDSVLRGIPGQRLVRYAAGSYIPVDGAEVDPVDGKDIVTTLDTYMQDIAEEELMNMLVNNHSKHGTVIIMETATGKIKAMANLGKDSADSEYYEKMNYGVGKATEPGSIFKLVTLLSLLDDKYVTNESVVNCEGGVKSFSGLRIKDSHGHTGTVSVKDAFAISSNVAFAKLADQYYGNQPQKWYDHMEKFRLTQPTGIDLMSTMGRPYVKKPTDASWSKTTIPYMAHGYEVLVSPLQMLTFYNAIANNGKMMKPYLVSSIRENGVEVKKILPQVLDDKIASDEAIAQAKACLRAVVEVKGATGHKKLFDTAYAISGKTGTAVSANDNEGYNKGNKVYQSSFIGYFPSEAPKYTIVVVVQNTRESKLKYGADVSGHIFKKISDKIYTHYLLNQQMENKYVKDSVKREFIMNKEFAKHVFQKLQIPFLDAAMEKGGTWGVLQFDGKQAEFRPSEPLNGTSSQQIPDVKGMLLRDAMILLETRGLITVVSGKGRVLSQSIPPGTQANKGQKILLMLN